ncbi:anti-sigma factor [Trinickia sp. EG282A]|uniref:anti-sigma factor n=1 Tax=Trinickia sp. EG282A TaxID=3237013 RepID=UPI0034D2151F
MNDYRDSGSSERLDLQTLSAFVDGELPDAAHAAVGAELERDPESMARVADWRAQKAALKALFGDVENEAPSVVVLRRPHSRMQRMAVAAGWLFVGVALGTIAGNLLPRALHSAHEPATFARRADIAYAVYAPEVRHPVEVGAQDEAHLASWLSKRLGRSLSIPSLQEYGYTLVGGRLLPGDSGPAAQFMYESRQGARLTLYVAAIPTDETAFRLLRDGDRRTFYWVSDHFGYALSGAISEEKLRSIAIDVCSELGGRPESWSESSSDSSR